MGSNLCDVNGSNRNSPVLFTNFNIDSGETRGGRGGRGGMEGTCVIQTNIVGDDLSFKGLDPWDNRNAHAVF